MKKSNQLKVALDELEHIEPVTENQKKAFDAWEQGHNLVLSGSAGTGKTFIALYLAFSKMLKYEQYNRLLIVRSMVSTRDGGHLPGTKEEKEEPYKAPYKSICGELFGYDGAWGKLTTTKSVGFETTSFIRGVTFDRTILVVDEMQNMNFHELDSIITRIGNDCKIIFCGDHNQTDFTRKDEKDGIIKFISLIEQMRFFRVINFGWVDIIRSDFVRDYIMTKEMMGF